MTQRRKTHCPQCGHDLDPISNYFDKLLDGIGHRGSSFTDIDAVSHDESTSRWLFQEFKGPRESLNRGQARHLKGLARQDYLTVWCVRKRGDGLVDWCDVASRRAETITVDEYRERFRRWWDRKPIVPQGATAAAPIIDAPMQPLTADDIRWGA